MSQRSRSKAKTLHLFQRTIRRVLQRPEELTVSEWAEKYRVLDESSNISGKWSNSITPYLVGIMDSINDPHIREIYFCKSSQVGGTEALINILGYLIMEEPAPAMIVYPSDDLAKDISNDKLKPAFRLIPQIRKIFYENDKCFVDLIQYFQYLFPVLYVSKLIFDHSLSGRAIVTLRHIPTGSFIT